MNGRSSVVAGDNKEQQPSPFALESENESDDRNNVGEERLHLTTESDSGDVSMTVATAERRPPGELERLESRRALRGSQANVIGRRRKSFIAEFSEMKGPPQIAMVMALLAMGLGATIGKFLNKEAWLLHSNPLSASSNTCSVAYLCFQASFPP